MLTYITLRLGRIWDEAVGVDEAGVPDGSGAGVVEGVVPDVVAVLLLVRLSFSEGHMFWVLLDFSSEGMYVELVHFKVELWRDAVMFVLCSLKGLLACQDDLECYGGNDYSLLSGW